MNFPYIFEVLVSFGVKEITVLPLQDKYNFPFPYFSSRMEDWEMVKKEEEEFRQFEVISIPIRINLHVHMHIEVNRGLNEVPPVFN